MSQLYHVQLRSSVKQSIDLSDKLVHQIELTPILPQSEMLELFAEQLEAEGFVRTGDGRFETIGLNDESIVVDLQAMTLTVSLEQQAELKVEVVADGHAEDDRGLARRRAQEQLISVEKKARERLKTEAKQAQQQLSQQLSNGEADRLRTINRVLQQVYAESLKRKARELGDIIELREQTQGDDYELVIKISQ